MSLDGRLATAGDTMCVSQASRVQARRPSCSRGTDPPDGGIMPHRQSMSRANCVQAGPRALRDTAQGTEVSGGGRTNTGQEIPPKARRNGPVLPFVIVARERANVQVGHHNCQPRSFTWTAKVEDILGKVERTQAVLHKMASV